METTDPLSEQPFRPRWPWLGGDLQTLRNVLRRIDPDLGPWPGERLHLDLPDGDRLWAVHHRPEGFRERPLVALVHGLGGSEDSTYLRATARHLLEAGYPVLRLTLRGAGPSVATCRGIYHAGASGDLAAAFAALPPGLLSSGLVAVGYSLGGNMVLKLAGELGAEAPLRAAVAVSAPIDLSATSRRFHRLRNRPYMRWLLAAVKAEALVPGRHLTAGERQAIERSRSFFAYDEEFIAPRHGFRDAADYYARSSALPLLTRIKVPTLVIHALDDPWVAPEPYIAFDWSRHDALQPRIERRGGHVGFHGRGSPDPWHDRQILEFLGRVTG